MSYIPRRPLAPAGIVALYALFAAVWLGASDWLLSLFVDDDLLHARIHVIKGTLFIVFSAGLLFLLLKAACALPKSGVELPGVAPRRRSLVLTLSGLVLTVPLLGLGIMRLHGPELEREAHATLQAVAALKAGLIERWLDERTADSRALASNTGFVHDVQAFLRSGDAQAHAAVVTQLDALRSIYGYGQTALLDATGQVLLGEHVEPPPEVLALLREALASEQVRQSDLHPHPASGIVHQDWIVPLATAPRTAVILHVQPTDFLFPLIERWPTPSPTAENLLVRRDGDEVVILNALRHPGAAHRHPLDAPDLPAALAMRTEATVNLVGRDYRGVDVLAAALPVPGSPWHLVAKIDRDEVREPLHVLVFWVGLVSFFAIMAVAAAVLLLWRQQQHAHRLALQAEVAEGVRESEARYRSLVTNLPGVVYRSAVDAEWTALYVSEAIEALTGHPAAELRNNRVCSFASLVYPDDLERIEAGLRRSFATREPFALEYRIRHRDGRIVWVQDRGRARYDAAGGVEWIDGFLWDITDRKQAEATLQANEAILQESQRIARLGHYALDVASLSWQGSTVLDDLFGISDAQPHAADTWLQLVHPDDREALATHLRDDVIRDRQLFDREYRIIRPSDGEVRWLHGLGRLELDGDGKALRVLGTVQDITARKRDEEHLRQAATVFDNTREGVLITDAQLRILRVNRSFCELTGYGEAEVLGQTPRMLQSGRHNAAYYSAMWKALRDDGHWQGEIWNRRKNGEVYPELLSISSVRDHTGQITHYVAVFADISHIKASEKELDFLAHHDALTRLPNRLVVLSRLEHRIESLRRSGGRLALLMLDLDRFKDVNDSFGHPAGDEILQQVAARVSGLLRASDTLARLGGDEFTILLENLSHAEDAARVATQIIEALRAPWQLSNGAKVHIGTSVGISLFPDHGDSADVLLQQADAALYRAKAEGRGCFKYFSEELTRAARERIELEARLRRALAEDQLRVHFQPQVDIASGAIVGAEALVRWQDPQAGLIMPGRFIPIAEETGLIGEIGLWVLRAACEQGRTWLDAGVPPITLAVNLAPHQLRHIDIVAAVDRALRETGFPPECLELELTESALMQREDEAAKILHSLRALGVRLSLDDFGTGYSSLAYIKRFPLDKLKIDRGFIEDLTRDRDDRDDREITATIISMGHSLGLKVLAEGVETEEQLAFLKAQGCDAYQGYLKSPAVEAEAFLRLVLR